ncbi:hypothetical protein V5799_029809, partial [Amblyomma americanum]
MHRATAWIAALALMVQALTLLSAQHYPDMDDHHPFTRLRPQSSLLGGIRPSRSSVVSARCVNPRLYFRNGLVKMRYRGRVAKYVCRPGYSLFGDSVSTCNAGRWDRPVPICAATVPDPDPSCDFEALDQCGWTSDLSSGVQFSRQHESKDEDDVAATDNGTTSV